MTDTDAMLMIGAIIIFALYAAWIWYEAKNAILYPDGTESQNKDAQAHKTTADAETQKKKTKTQQEARK